MKNTFAHILAFGGENAWKTLEGFEFTVCEVKRAGFQTLVVLPSIFEGNLTKEEVACIARKHGIKLTCCGFLPGGKFTLYLNGFTGITPAINELRKQFAWQVYFVSLSVGTKWVCGPVFDSWRAGSTTSVGQLPHFEPYCRAVVELLEELDLYLAVEILNRHETCLQSPHECIPEIVRKISSPRLKIHADIVHLASYVGMEKVLEFLTQHKDIIAVLELGMPGREPMESVSRFVEIAAALFELWANEIPDVSLGVEQFDYKSVIIEFGLTGIYASKVPGPDVFWKDVRFLQKHNVLALVA